jgi:tetratricopeptide (TPR) repeat protein
MLKRIGFITLVGLFILCVAAFLVYQAPVVHERPAWRLANLQAKVQRIFNPPEALVFVPGGTAEPGLVETIAKATLDVLEAAVTANPTAASLAPQAVEVTPNDPGPTAAVTVQPTFTPSPTSTPLPEKTLLNGIVHEYQQFNNCGPTNLAMALSYWGWQGDQRETRLYLRPNLQVDDKNVMPSEMVAYVEQFTGLAALTRVGGDLELLRSLLAAGYPVLIEAGHDPPDDSWMGHYLVVNGYDDGLRMFTVQDSLTNPDAPMTYDDLTQHWWRDFNYVYLVIYPKERQAELERLLGPRLDETTSYQLAAQKALDEITRLQERDLFFAWFDLGTSQVGLADYGAAAQAYDKAFEIYQSLPEDLRPYRLMWYQVGPYQAYYNTGRYQDVINLANTTFTWASKPVLEESYYWRGMAYLALGISNQAIADLKKAAALNPNYELPRLELARLGIALP